MSFPSDVDGVLVQWGDRLFYPSNRIVKDRGRSGVSILPGKARATAIRARIEATVRHAPQVMVKVTGGGRGMKAIAAHFRYISKNGRLDIEDELGNVERGKEAVRELAEDWRVGGSRIEDVGFRREAFNIMLSMPRGVDPLVVQRAASEFAQIELAGHKYVMVLHGHQANPHVHISVRAESKRGTRLNPRKADLHRWRETFAERLRGWGIDAEASRQVTRGENRNYAPLWRVKARADGRERKAVADRKASLGARTSREDAQRAWGRIAGALVSSADADDRRLAEAVHRWKGVAQARTNERRIEVTPDRPRAKVKTGCDEVRRPASNDCRQW